MIGDWGKNHPIFEKSSQNSRFSKKCLNIYIKAQFESLKHVQQTTFEALKYLQNHVLKLVISVNVKKIARAKSNPKCCLYYIFSKSRNGHPKVAQLVKNRPIWSPCFHPHWLWIRHYDNTYEDFSYNDFTYDIHKCEITCMFFLFTVISKVIYN